MVGWLGTTFVYATLSGFWLNVSIAMRMLRRLCLILFFFGFTYKELFYTNLIH